MINNKLYDVVCNHYILPYINILKHNQYLIIYNKDEDIIGRFRCENENIYEIYDIFHESNVDEYIEEGTYKFSVMEIDNPDYLLNKYVICERQEYVKRMKESIKKTVEKNLQDINGNIYKSVNEDIQKDGGKLVYFRHDDNGLGILLGACCSDEDIYWIYFNTDLNIRLTTCLEAYIVIDEKEFTDQIVKDMLEIKKNQHSLIQRKLNECFSDRIDYVFTEIKY